jgi:hypothetical protein
MSTPLSLAALWPDSVLKEAILDLKEWKPYPGAGERGRWEALPEERKQLLVKNAEEAAQLPWPNVPASIYLQYQQNGNRSNYEALHFGRRRILTALVLGECVKGEGKWLHAILDALWSICEESSWCLPAHIGMQRAGSGLPDTAEPILDLFAAETGSLLAWTQYLLGAQLARISPLVPERIRREVDHRILAPALERSDYFWMGFVERPVNNWNPWINSNWLACALLLEMDSNRRLQAIQKILRSLDNFLLDYPEDGGCDEGPSYWGRAGASLFDCLDLLDSASAGHLTAYDAPLVCNMARYIYCAHIAEDYYLNFADAPAVVTPNPAVVYRFGRKIGDERMAGFGLWLAERLRQREKTAEKRWAHLGEGLTRDLRSLFLMEPVQAEKGSAPLLRDAWLPGIQVMAARADEASAEGLFLAAKGGHNGESHNHNDVGHFVVYRDGDPLIIDVGVETYTRKTFSAQRYEIWTMQSAYHSLPTIDGYQQVPGKNFNARSVAYRADEERAVFELDLAGAYPREAGVRRWMRRLTLWRGQRVSLVDEFELDKAPQTLTLSLLCASSLDLSQAGLARLKTVVLPNGRVSAKGIIRYDAQRFSTSAEEIKISDDNLRPVWGQRVWRILLSAREPQANGRWELTIE